MKPAFFFIAIFFSINSYAQTLDELWKEYFSDNYSYVLQNALRQEREGEGNVDLKLLIGRTYTDSHQPSKALSYLLYVYNSDKAKGYQKAWAAHYLGTAYYMLLSRAESKKYLMDAIGLNATVNVTRNSKKNAALFGFSDAYDNFHIRESDHIVFHFHPQYKGNVKAFMEEREQSYKSINSFFNSTLPKKIDFFVWDTEQNLFAATGSANGFANAEYCITHSVFSQTPGHEIAHVISHYSVNVFKKSTLVNEGTAVYFDQTKRGRIERARDVLKSANLNVSIRDNWDSRQLDGGVLYPVAGGFIEFLLEKEGKDKFLALLKDQTIENAGRVYGKDRFDSLIKEFENLVNPNHNKAHINLQQVSVASLPKLDPAIVKASIEQNPSDQYYKVLILVDGLPVTKSDLEKIDPAVIKDLQVIKSKDDMQKYTEVELNSIIVITRKK